MHKIIIDTDPGQDDAVAILLALASPELELVGITTVAGNVPVDLTFRNARRVVHLAARDDVPVRRGAEKPLIRDLITAELVHGPSGLDGHDLEDPAEPPSDEHAVDWLIRTVMAAEEKSITLCCLAPLTNIALAFSREPRLPGRLAGIVMMGGAFFNGGNSTPVAEFNVLVDPHAAQIVLQSGVPITMLPLDATHQVRTTPDRLARLYALGHPVATAAANLIDFNDRFDRERYGIDGGPLHDPTVIAYLLGPHLFEGETINVLVELTGRYTTGMTVMDWWRMTGRDPNATVINAIDAPGFYDLLIERLGRL